MSSNFDNNTNYTFTDYEGDVYDLMEELGEMDRSDAQGVCMVPDNEEIIHDNYYNSVDAETTVKQILSKSKPTQHETL